MVTCRLNCRNYLDGDGSGRKDERSVSLIRFAEPNHATTFVDLEDHLDARKWEYESAWDSSKVAWFASFDLRLLTDVMSELPRRANFWRIICDINVRWLTFLWYCCELPVLLVDSTCEQDPTEVDLAVKSRNTTCTSGTFLYSYGS